MATGGSFSRTLEGGHEPFYDFPCSLCEEEGKHVEAVRYCEECYVFLCDPCLKEKHNKFPLHRRHQLLDKSQFSTVNKHALTSFPTKRCQKHRGELINIFCKKHNVVCCSVCKALEHSNCATQHLPDAAKGIQKSKEYRSIKTDTRSLISDLNKVINDRGMGVSRIAKEKYQATKAIQDCRKRINKYFDDLEKNTLAELDQRERTIVGNFDQDKKYLESTKSKAENVLKQLESFRGDNECELFFQVKTGLQFLNETLEKLNNMRKTDEKPSIQFEIESSIEVYVASLESFGSFSTANVQTFPPLASSQVTPVVPVVSTTHKQSAQYVQHLTYKFQGCKKYNMKDKSDTDTDDIVNICQMPDDTFLITYLDNKKLKRLDQTLKLLDSVQLSGIPHSVCAAGPGQVAVSLTLSKTIQFVSVGKKLTLTRSVTVENDCIGLAYIGDELFVCCGGVFDPSIGCIEVYNNAGQLQRTIARVPQELRSAPRYITVSDDGQHLFVICNNSNDVYMLDLTGNVVSTFSHKDLKTPAGICTDGRGQVFVCGYYSNTVVQLSPWQQKTEVILREADGIYKPQLVHFDRQRSRLLVSKFECNDLLVFTLK